MLKINKAANGMYGLILAWAVGASPVWAEEGLPGDWGNTLGAEAGAVINPGHAGTIFLALLLVLVLALLLGWWVKRRRPGTNGAVAETGRLIFSSQFNAAQTFLLWEEGGKTFALITKHRKIEMLAELPGVRTGFGESGGRRESGSPKTFQEIWQAILQAKRSRG